MVMVVVALVVSGDGDGGDVGDGGDGYDMGR